MVRISLVAGIALCWMVGCSGPPPADLVFLNGRVWTGLDSASFSEAVAIKGNTIVEVGSTEAIRKFIGNQTQEIDLQGKLMIPGFNDAHIHFLGGSIGLTEVDLNDVASVQELVGRISKFAQANPSKNWITGRGWQYTQFEGGLPTKEILDAALGDRPVFVKAYDGHSAWANSAALRAAGITRHTIFKGFGEIVHASNGEPTGIFKEGAMALIGDIIPPLTRQEKIDALRLGLRQAAILGITSIANASGSPEELMLYKTMMDNNELTVRVAAAFSADATTTDQQVARYTALKDSVGTNNHLTTGAVKFMLDGVIESHTAAMLEPYSNLVKGEPSPAGALAMPIETYQRLVNVFDKNGFQLYTHAIGDRAVHEALNAYEHASKENGTHTRHRIEHIETISPTDIPRFASLGVLPSMEPIHAEPGTVKVWAAGVGDRRLPNSFAWASIKGAGGHLIFSSDWPACVSLNPIRGLHTAVTRRTIDGMPRNGWVPAQKISITAALTAYTQGGAYSSGEEKTKGRIAKGYLADVVVLSQDLFAIDPMRTYQTEVLMTVFDGKVIYSRP